MLASEGISLQLAAAALGELGVALDWIRATPEIRENAEHAGVLGQRTRELFRLVSPLSVTPSA